MIARIAGRVGYTEGQLYSVVTGLVAAIVLVTASVHVSGVSPLKSFVVPSATRRAGVAAAPAVPSSPSAVGPVAGAVYAPPTDARSAAVGPGAPAPAANIAGVFAVVGAPGAPGGIAVLRDGSVIVSTDNGTGRGVPGPSKLFRYGAGGSLLGDLAVTGQPEGHTSGLGATAADPRDGSVVVVDRSSSRVLRIDPAAGREGDRVAVADVPPCALVVNQAPCEPGAIDHVPNPAALAVDGSGNVLVADAGQATIWRWRAGQPRLDPWYQSDDLLAGDGPAGLAVDAAGTVWFTAATTLDPSSPGAGALYRLTVDPGGKPGSRSFVAGFASDQRPGPLALGRGGSVFVILRGSGAIAVVSDGTTTAFPTQGSPVPLEDPSGLAVDGHRLLVTNGTNSKVPSAWTVLTFPI